MSEHQTAATGRETSAKELRDGFLARCTHRQRDHGTHGSPNYGGPCAKNAERCVQCVIEQAVSELHAASLALVQSRPELSPEDAAIVEAAVAGTSARIRAALAPIAGAQDLHERISVLERAVGNCFMMAKREIARLWKHQGEESSLAQTIERWQHVQRFCETTGSKSNILRGQLPTEITEGAAPSRVAPPSGRFANQYGVAPPSGAEPTPHLWYAHHADLGHTLTSRGAHTECSCGAVSPSFAASLAPVQSRPELSPEDAAIVEAAVAGTSARIRAALAPVAGATDGVALIAAERQRQVSFKGWTPEHDDAHSQGELAVSAIRYALEDVEIPLGNVDSAKEDLAALWSWESCDWKPKDPIRNLVRAGALIAAEIDRRQRQPAPSRVAPPSGRFANQYGVAPPSGAPIMDYTNALPHDFQVSRPGAIPHCSRCHVPQGSAESKWNDGKCDKTIPSEDLRLRPSRLAGATKPEADLLAWKEDAQTFMRAAGVKLLNAGYQGESLIDGIQWLCDRASAAPPPVSPPGVAPSELSAEDVAIVDAAVAATDVRVRRVPASGPSDERSVR